MPTQDELVGLYGSAITSKNGYKLINLIPFCLDIRRAVSYTIPAMRLTFFEHIGMRIEEQRAGFSKCSLTVMPHHFNSVAVVHGAVLFALADSGMGAALFPTLGPGEVCATIEIKINYFKPVVGGNIVCTSELINRGKTVANLESSAYVNGVLVAKANGSFSIFKGKDVSTP